MEVGGGFPNSEKMAATYSTEFLSDETYGELDLQVQGDSEGNSAFYSSSSYAKVDPYIYIDPDFLAANPGVSLEISAGVGNFAPNMTAAPEPATWAMMLIGFAGLGFAGFRQRLNRASSRRPA